MEDVARRQFAVSTCLGKGGFGEVYRATMTTVTGIGMDVAVKVLRGDLDPRGQALERLRDEGKLLAHLDHPVILKVHDLVLLDGCVCLVTEFVDGEDVGACLVGPGKMPIRALLEVISQTAAALDAAWNAKKSDGTPLRLVHRDIKPSNIRISRHGQVKLLDFGIARSDSVEREAKTQTNMMVGSPQYMAPERFLDAVVRPASDVFALGCVLYEGLCDGQRLHSESSFPILSAIAVDDERYEMHLERRFAKIPDGTDPRVLELLGSLLQYDPDKRPTAAETVKLCESLADEVAGASLQRWARERKWATTAHDDDAPLVGRTITEGTMTRARATRTGSQPIPNPAANATASQPMPVTRFEMVGPPAANTSTTEVDRAPRAGWGWGRIVALALVTLLIVGAIVGSALGGAGLVAVVMSGGGTVAEAPAEDPVTEPVATPIEPPVEPGPTETVATLPVEPIIEAPAADPPKVPVTRPSTTTRPVETAPVETPKPVVTADPPKPASTLVPVALEGDGKVTLMRSGSEWDLPASVPPGEYTVVLHLGESDATQPAKLIVAQDTTPKVICKTRMQRCTYSQ